MLKNGIDCNAPVLGKIIGQESSDDVILKMQFKATNHAVQMYNFVYFSSKELAMQGIDPGCAQSMGTVLDAIYQKYQTLRTAFIKSEPQAVTDFEIAELISGYCSELESHPLVLKYWVTIHYNNRIWDSKKMGLHK